MVDEATHGSICWVSGHNIGDVHLTRTVNEIRTERGRPKMITNANGLEFIGKAMQTCENGSWFQLRLIEYGTQNQNAYV